MKKILFILIFVFIYINAVSAHAIIKGQGSGKTEKEAKTDALSDLSQSIQVNITSEFQSIVHVRGDDVKKNRAKYLHSKSDLPILGAEFNVFPAKDCFMAEAFLDEKNVVLYEKELLNSKHLIDKNYGLLKNEITNREKVNFLKAMLTNIDMFNKYRVVAEFLKSNNIPEQKITKEEIQNQLKNQFTKADTLKFGLKMMAKDIKEKGIFIFPPTTKNSSEITQFGSAVKDILSMYLTTIHNPRRAYYYLIGEYQILKNGIDLTYKLVTPQYRTLNTFVVSFLPVAYKNYEIEPKTISFDKLIKTGVVVSGDLRASITTNIGKKDLLFKKGKSFRLLVKMNKPGYFYIVVHSLKEGETYSYMIDFFNENSNRKFIYHVNADDVNRWIELGEFEVVPPFGVETLQMMASDHDLIDKVPPNFYDRKTKLYKVGTNPFDAVARTRGIIRKQRVRPGAGKKPSHSEAVLIFTTMN